MRRIIQVGVGGYGRTWLQTVADAGDRVEYAALVDTNADLLAEARSKTHVPSQLCFTTIEEALQATDADSVLCVVPPAHHEAVLNAALDAGKHVLTEKPIADTMAASCRIVERAQRSKGTLMVAQKGRFLPWVKRFREAIENKEAGELSHLTLHYRAAIFKWGETDFRHLMDNPLLIEQSIHHFDLIRALLGRDPIDVAGFSWNTAWSGYRGDVATLLFFTMDDGIPVVYEAYCRSSGDLTSWYGDIRAECEEGVVAMVFPQLYIARRGANQMLVTAPREDLMRVSDVATGLLVAQEGQTLLFREFLDATDEGRVPESVASDNLASVAMVFAAADACANGERRAIADYLPPSKGAPALGEDGTKPSASLLGQSG